MSELIEVTAKQNKIVLSRLTQQNQKMAKGKRMREKGKIRLSSYFKNLDKGQKVSVVPDAGIRSAFPKRIKGKTGVILESRGTFKVVEINDGNKAKKFIIHPIHLRKI